MEKDVERPCLGCRPCSDDLPLILSTSPLIQVPASIAKYLRDYQRDGVRFLFQLYKNRNGGILGDDMGLGKTIQAIAFMAAVLKMNGTVEDKLRHVSDFIRQDVAPNFVAPSVNPILVICPASLMDNWVQEVLTWGFFKVLKLNTVNRLEILNIAKHQDCDIVVTTYETARSYIDLLNMVVWCAVFVDEVHRIKDIGSQTTKALYSIDCKCRYGLTGTPFQNNLKEMWCILNWASPNCLGQSTTFSTNIVKAIELGQRHHATKRNYTEARIARVKLTTLCRRVMLRRTKDILAKHLPSKTDQIVFCDLTSLQEGIYHALIQSADVQALLTPIPCSARRVGLLFTYLHLLQKVANHPGLLISSALTNETAYAACLRVLQNDTEIKGGLCKKKISEALNNINASGKMLVLFQLMSSFLERGDKILVFSYSTKLLDLVEKQIVKERYRYYRLDGSTPVDKRHDLVRTFNSSSYPSVFLISTKTGGVGLNITGANVVIIYDPNWNPAHDLQAQDRAYRIGQERDVRVYRLLSTATIEEFVYLRQLYKQQLGSVSVSNKNVRRYFNSVSGDTRYYGELFGIHNLFTFRQSKRSLTEEILDRQKSLENTLQLKLQVPLTDETSGAKVVLCLLQTDEDHERTHTTKSGLIQLCEDFLEGGDETLLEYATDHEHEADENDEEEYPEAGDSIANILETTVAVRNIVEHDEVVASSRVEEFIEDCAVRDVLQKQRNSQLPAFDCSSNSQDMSIKGQNARPAASSGHSWISCQIIFQRMARDEYLTPYELGLKVLSMSDYEKKLLLNKHQKRKLSTSTEDSVSVINGDEHEKEKLCTSSEDSVAVNKALKPCPVYILPSVISVGSASKEDLPSSQPIPHKSSGIACCTTRGSPSSAECRFNPPVSQAFTSTITSHSINTPDLVEQASVPKKKKLDIHINFAKKETCPSFPDKTLSPPCSSISKTSAAVLDSWFFSNFENKQSKEKKHPEPTKGSRVSIKLSHSTLIAPSTSPLTSEPKRSCTTASTSRRSEGSFDDSTKDLLDNLLFSKSRFHQPHSPSGSTSEYRSLSPLAATKQFLENTFLVEPSKEKPIHMRVELSDNCSPEFDPKDDVFLNLFKTGKLKKVSNVMGANRE